MKNIFTKIFKYLFIGIASIALVTIGIDASDKYDNLSESIIGKMLFNSPDGPCLPEMVFVPTDNGGFCIDKYEVSPGDKCAYNNVLDQSMTRDNLNLKECIPVSKANATPWRFVSQTQAITACAKAGKRLPTDEEWYLASVGTPDKDGGWTGSDCQVSNNWPQQPGTTGYAENCVSAYGAYDMVGNVWEWVNGEISDGIYKGKTMPGPGYITAVDVNGIPTETNINTADPNFNKDYLWIKETGTRGLARGGYFGNDAGAGVYSAYLVSPSSFAGTGVGFRCVQ